MFPGISLQINSANNMQAIKDKPDVAEHHITVEICPGPDGSPVTRKSTEETAVRVDYSGASAKTDPAEIKLVRKLDMIIMVSADSPRNRTT